MEETTHKEPVNIAECIKVIRTRRELTQEALARLSEVPYTTLSKIESNVIKNPSIQTIIKLANALDVTLDELIKSTNE